MWYTQITVKTQTTPILFSSAIAHESHNFIVLWPQGTPLSTFIIPCLQFAIPIQVLPKLLYFIVIIVLKPYLFVCHVTLATTKPVARDFTCIYPARHVVFTYPVNNIYLSNWISRCSINYIKLLSMISNALRNALWCHCLPGENKYLCW